MFSNLKLLFAFCKIFGLIPVKNIFQERSFQMKITLCSCETLILLSFKWLIYFAFFIKFLNSDFFPFTIPLSFIALFYDVGQLLHFQKLFSCLILLQKFENLGIIQIEKSRRYQLKWLGFIFVATLLNFFMRLVCSGSNSSDEISWHIVSIFVTFPTVSIPVSFTVFCIILTRSFQSLDVTCEQFYDTMTNSNIFSLHSQNSILSKMEFLRLAHSILCDSILEFRRFFDFPMFFYLLVFLLEVFYSCFLIMFKHEIFHFYHSLKFIFNFSMILCVTTKMDLLHTSVSP